MKITRDVVVDLWPALQAGDASADTRALVEDFLAQDPELARRLRAETGTRVLEPVSVPLGPDPATHSSVRTRRDAHRLDGSLQLAIVFTAIAFGRILADTSWDVSPRNFVITAAIALALWIAFFVRHARRRAASR